MSYRDPNEALRAENESLQQQIKDANEELDGRRARVGASAEGDGERQRLALGMRCLGGVALMLPFLLMTAMCEHRFTPRYHHAPASMAVRYDAAPSVASAVNVPRPYVAHGCQGRTAPSPGFEGFTRSIERSARVTQANHHASPDSVPAGRPGERQRQAAGSGQESAGFRGRLRPRVGSAGRLRTRHHRHPSKGGR